MPASGVCSCNRGYVGVSCSECDDGFITSSAPSAAVRTCVYLAGARSTCNDGVRDGGETGVDCGGLCSACAMTSSSSSGSTLVAVAASVGGASAAVILVTAAACIAYRRRHGLSRSRAAKHRPSARMSTVMLNSKHRGSVVVDARLRTVPTVSAGSRVSVMPLVVAQAVARRVDSRVSNTEGRTGSGGNVGHGAAPASGYECAPVGSLVVAQTVSRPVDCVLTRDGVAAGSGDAAGAGTSADCADQLWSSPAHLFKADSDAGRGGSAGVDHTEVRPSSSLVPNARTVSRRAGAAGRGTRVQPTSADSPTQPVPVEEWPSASPRSTRRGAGFRGVAPTRWGSE